MSPLTDASTTSQKYEKNINFTLKRLRDSHLSNVIFWFLNINSIRNKFGDLNKIVDGNIDNLKQNRNQRTLFPIISPYISIISPYILDITKNKDGLMVFVKSDIPSSRLNYFKIPSNTFIILLLYLILYFYYTFIIPFNGKRKIVTCINLHRSIPKKQIFFLYEIMKL